MLSGSLLQGFSAVYRKKDWGEEYHAMLQKNSQQVNELKLTDFEAANYDAGMEEEGEIVEFVASV